MRTLRLLPYITAFCLLSCNTPSPREQAPAQKPSESLFSADCVHWDTAESLKISATDRVFMKTKDVVLYHDYSNRMTIANKGNDYQLHDYSMDDLALSISHRSIDAALMDGKVNHRDSLVDFYESIAAIAASSLPDHWAIMDMAGTKHLQGLHFVAMLTSTRQCLNNPMDKIVYCDLEKTSCRLVSTDPKKSDLAKAKQCLESVGLREATKVAAYKRACQRLTSPQFIAARDSLRARTQKCLGIKDDALIFRDFTKTCKQLDRVIELIAK